MINLRCNRCGGSFVARTEYDAELKFNEHRCRGPDNSALPFDLLRKLAYGTITEQQAWAEVARRKGQT